MKSKVTLLVCVLVCFALSVSVFGQEKKGAGGQGKAAAAPADAIAGTWTGDWGPSASDRNAVTVELKHDGKGAVTGTVNPGASPVTLMKSTFNASTGAVHMEADAPGRGGTLHFVIDGKVDKNTMTGTWNHGNVKGDFKIIKK